MKIYAIQLTFSGGRHKLQNFEAQANSSYEALAVIFPLIKFPSGSFEVKIKLKEMEN